MKENTEHLITVATLTYAKALILQNVLGTAGIDTTIQNVNEIQPLITSGVRVRIHERDLPQALSIIESKEWLSDRVVGEELLESDSHGKPTMPIILVPVDFSEYSIKSIRIAFNIAQELHAEVRLLHVYFAPIYANTLPYYNDLLFPDADKTKEISSLLVKVHHDFDKLSEEVKKLIAKEHYTDVKYDCVLSEGIPEEEINRYARLNHVEMIVMGMRGKEKRDSELIGSVTADLFDRSRIPILAVPENSSLTSIYEVSHIGFLTNYSQRDLIAFDSFYKRLADKKFKVTFYHLEGKKTSQVEDQIVAGLMKYFREKYPEVGFDFEMIPQGNQMEDLDRSITDNRISLLVTSSHKRTIFSNLFTPSITKKIIFHSKTPLLIMYH